MTTGTPTHIISGVNPGPFHHPLRTPFPEPELLTLALPLCVFQVRFALTAGSAALAMVAVPFMTPLGLRVSP